MAIWTGFYETIKQRTIKQRTDAYKLTLKQLKHGIFTGQLILLSNFFFCVEQFSFTNIIEEYIYLATHILNNTAADRVWMTPCYTQ